MPKKSLIKSLISEEKEILQAAHDCNFYSLHDSNKKEAFTILFKKLDILKKLKTKKKFKEAEDKFRLFFWTKTNTGLKEYSTRVAQVGEEGVAQVGEEGVAQVGEEGVAQVGEEGVVDNNTVASYLKVSKLLINLHKNSSALNWLKFTKDYNE